MSQSAPPIYAHLEKMSDEWGIFEHALLDEPRREEGYCLDDVSRALIVASRGARENALLSHLTQTYLDFIEEAVSADGQAHNRRNAQGEWTDSPAVGDWWGRALWGLGTLVSTKPDDATMSRAMEVALRAMQQQSPFIRTNVFAVIGASELLILDRRNLKIREFIETALTKIPQGASEHWPWPEPRMTYGNGSVAEAMIASGIALGVKNSIDRGLQLVNFLVSTERHQGNLSVTGVAGRTRDCFKPQFDQQPIEVSAIADASARAYTVTQNPTWLEGLDQAWRWFNGHNDAQAQMYDVDSGAGFDGLEPHGRNENRGAESTLAALSTHQHFLRFENVLETR
jgi:hypothetical protein